MRNAIMFVLALAGCATRPEPVNTPANTGAYREPSAPPEVTDWVMLSPTVQTSSMQQLIEVGTTNRPFSQLLLKAVDGEPQIEMLQIQYADDELKQVDVHRKLVAGDGQVIELRENRAIKKITVITDPDSHGSYTIFGT